AVPREQLARIHASSGTTGKPTIIGYTRNDLELWDGLIARCISVAGGKPGDLIHNSYGYGLFNGGLGLHGVAEELCCAVVAGPGVAQERANDRGAVTIWEDAFYPEILDPKTGEVLPEGEEGELALTSLSKEAVPVIRYRTGDLTRLLPPEGEIPMRRMARILG